MHEGSRIYPDAHTELGKPTTTASSRAAARFWSSGAGGRYRIPPRFQGEPPGGYVSCRNALSDSGSLVTVSMLKRGEESLNPFTMQ
jgi:hypothetical protein